MLWWLSFFKSSEDLLAEQKRAEKKHVDDHIDEMNKHVDAPENSRSWRNSIISQEDLEALSPFPKSPKQSPKQSPKKSPKESPSHSPKKRN